MTAASITAGTVLLCTAIVSPFSLLWAPGAVLLGYGYWRHHTRRQRWAKRRAGARKGWIG